MITNISLVFSIVALVFSILSLHKVKVNGRRELGERIGMLDRMRRRNELNTNCFNELNERINDIDGVITRHQNQEARKAERKRHEEYLMSMPEYKESDFVKVDSEYTFYSTGNKRTILVVVSSDEKSPLFRIDNNQYRFVTEVDGNYIYKIVRGERKC